MVKGLRTGLLLQRLGLSRMHTALFVHPEDEEWVGVLDLKDDLCHLLAFPP